MLLLATLRYARAEMWKAEKSRLEYIRPTKVCKAIFWSRWCLINFLLQPRFAYKVGDGVCDQILNTADCCYDGNDCKSFASECSQCPRNFVNILRLHKGKCLPSFNTPQCCYSLGACSNINECRHSAKLPLVQKHAQVCAYTFNDYRQKLCLFVFYPYLHINCVAPSCFRASHN